MLKKEIIKMTMFNTAARKQSDSLQNLLDDRTIKPYSSGILVFYSSAQANCKMKSNQTHIREK